MHGVRDRQLNKEGARSPACCCEPRSDGTMRCNNFVIFPYLVTRPPLPLLPPIARSMCPYEPAPALPRSAPSHPALAWQDDVLPGDGGVFVLPGSRKALVTRPGDLFGEYVRAQVLGWHLHTAV